MFQDPDTVTDYSSHSLRVQNVLYLDNFHVYLFIKFFRLKDWSDYDEKAGQAVGIYEVTHRFVKLH